MKQRFSTRTRLVSALLTLAMVCTFLPISAFAEEELTDNYGPIYITDHVVLDETFREYLKKFDTNGDNVLTPAERYAVKEIFVGNKNISNLYGIQFFPNLKELDCSYNNLTSLDVSENTKLTELSCGDNQLKELNVSKNTQLKNLYCYGNNLTSLDVSRNAKLTNMRCDVNRLTSLYLNQEMRQLECEENELTSLDVSKCTELYRLECDDNNLTSLDVSKNTELNALFCQKNQLTQLDVSNNPRLYALYCNENNLTSLDVSKNTELEYLYCNDNQLMELDLSRNNKLFVLDASNNYLTNLNADNTSIDIYNSSSKFVARDNTYPITVGSDRTFDLSNLPGTFDVTKAKATKWNGGTVSGNTLTVKAGATKVTYLYDCGKNSWKTFTLNVKVAPDGSIGINASNFPDPNFRAYVKEKLDTDNNNFLSESEREAVTKIYVQEGYKGKKIKDLTGIQYFSKLEQLYCYDNRLTELDVSENTALKILDCANNKLNSLDVSHNIALKNLNCRNTTLNSLDVTQNTALEELICSSNSLTSLDVSKNIALQQLWCSQNWLTELDVSKNAALKDLDCSQNSLAILNVSQNEELDQLNCDKNNLTSLDVSKNLVLRFLHCERNKLTRLDVSKNAELKYLDCKNNQLTNLNVEGTNVGDPAIFLSELYAQGNAYSIAVEKTPRTFNLSNLPGKFDVTKVTNWNGGTVSGKTLKVDEGVDKVTYTYYCGKDCSETFTLNVTVVPDGTVTPPTGGDTPGGSTPGGTTPGGSTGGGDGGGAIVIVAAAGAAVAGVVGYGVYNYVSGQKLQALLPEGVAAPENRAQTALLLWNTAGRPEPADAPAFADVADPDTAKAAQWCVEQGLMKRRLNGKFAPGSSIPAYQVLNAYRKLAGG